MKAASAELEILDGNTYKLSNVYQKEKRDTVSTIKEQFINRNFTQSLEVTEKNASVIFSIDCSNDRVQCGTVTCDLAALKTLQDASVVLSLTLNMKSLQKFLPIGSVLQYGTRAQTKILNPLKDASEKFLITKFYNVENTNVNRPVNIWVIVISVMVGLVILSVIAIILQRVCTTFFLHISIIG